MSTGPEIPRWLRAAFRVPERRYRVGLGSLLDRRFLRLGHRGRRSGAPYATVLEVVACDRRMPEFVVVSGFGARADWLRNIEAGGPVEVTVGRRTFPAEHRRLELDEALGVFADYERRNRAAGPILRGCSRGCWVGGTTDPPRLACGWSSSCPDRLPAQDELSEQARRGGGCQPVLATPMLPVAGKSLLTLSAAVRPVAARGVATDWP